MNKNPTYTQVVDENGTIKFVPTSPPPSSSPLSGSQKGEQQQKDAQPQSHFGGAVAEEFDQYTRDGEDGQKPRHEVTENKQLTNLLRTLQDNNKRLRHKYRLDSGKLDSRRLPSYKVSDKLFKRRAIKHRDYRFTFLLDTSGSMLGQIGSYDDLPPDYDPGEHSKIQMAIDTLLSTAKSLEELDIPSAIVCMNLSVKLAKGFDDKLDGEQVVEHIRNNVCHTYQEDGRGRYSAGGTNEMVAYKQTLDYLDRTRPHGKSTQDVVIVLSDGEPNDEFDEVLVDFGEPRMVPNISGHDTKSMAHFWDKQHQLKVVGIGLDSRARQIPVNKNINHPEELTPLMGTLLQDILL